MTTLAIDDIVAKDANELRATFAEHTKTLEKGTLDEKRAIAAVHVLKLFFW